MTSSGELTDAVKQAVFECSGRYPEMSTGGGTSDGRFIAPTGAQVIELGPLNASIHQVNEHIAIRDLPKLSRMYERIAELLLLS
jgi:succinyl-diaminopimelate desuccinylase